MQAIKDIALRLINSHVGPYVDNLNEKDLNVSWFNGNFDYTGLHLKKSVLERFGLPVEIVAGDIGKLSIKIPWTAMKDSPCRVEIDDVYILARAKPHGKVDPEEDERNEQAAKQDRLRTAEEVDNAASQVGAKGQTDEAKQTYVGAIIAKVVDNLQVRVKNIHIRYEDGTSTPDHPFAAGITLTEFTAISTDENWVEAFITQSMHGVHKLVKLGALSVYFDTDTGSLDKGANDRAGTLDALKTMLLGNPAHQYILKPVTGEARVIMNKHMTNETPRIDAQVMFDEIGVVFDRDQYRDALSMVDVFHFYRRTHQYHKFRPPEEEFQKNAARARLRFALDAISSEIHEKHRRSTWAYIKERRDTRKRYVEVYLKKLALPEGKTLGAEDAAALESMETAASYEDIRFFRSVARAQAKKDAATRRKLEAERKKNAPQRQTWGEWLWGVPKDGDEPGGMTEEERKELDDIIDFDASAAVSIGSIPRDFMKARISAKLNKGSFSLRTDPHGQTTDIIALVFDSFSADALQLTESISGKFALGGFRVYDGTTKDSLYPQIVRVKDIDSSSSTGGPSRQTSLDVGGTDGALAEISDGTDADADKDPFFVMQVEQNPLDGHADNAVTVKMRHLEIIYHRGYVEAVVAFFRPPASQLESISALLDAAGQTLDGIRKETRAGLEYALEQHKTIDLRVDMNAPIIVIPMDVRVKDSQAIVLDAGHIAIESKLADQEQLKEVQSKRGRQYSEEDYRQLEDLMYDKLSLRLESAQLLMGPSIEACMKAIESPHDVDQTDLHILERINMSFSVQNAIVNAPNLTRFKIAGELPELHVNFSDRKYKNLMRFIDVAIPRFGDSPPVQEAPPTIPATARPSFRQRQIEEYNLDDSHSIMSHRTADNDKDDDESSVGGKGQDQFYEARDDTTESQRHALQQITFEFSFSVGKLQASLFKSTSATTEKPLAVALLEGFGLTFDLRKYDMSVDLFLRSITLGMVEQGELRKPLLCSAHDGSGDRDLKLIQLRYMKVQKDSPEFMTVHEGVDQSIDAELSTFNITVAPEPILSLYDFIMTTFVPKDETTPAANAAGREGAMQAQGEQAQAKSADKIRLRVKLTSIQVSLENNDMRFARLALPAVDVAILLRNGTMRISARLGNISLEDLSENPVAVPSFKKLLAIEGEELADFSYETFDPTDDVTFPGYNSSIHLRAGSLKFTFMEKPVHDLYAFATKFARMKAIYDAASQAAVQRASEVTRMHYDVVVKTPIIVLPRDGLTSPDVVILRLGEIIAKNAYLGDPNDTSTIGASLRGINVVSEIEVDGQKGTLQMVDDVAITANVKQAGGQSHRAQQDQADTEVTAEMSDVKLSLTQRQYALVMGIVNDLPRALSGINDEDEAIDTPPETVDTPSNPPTPSKEQDQPQYGVNLEPELAVVPTGPDAPLVWTSLDFVFTVGSIAMEVYTADAILEADLKNNSIARFALTQTHVGMKRLSSGAMEAEFSLQALSFSNTRAGSSVFRDIIPSAKHSGKQVMVQYTMHGGGDNSAIAIVTIDSPRFILAVDPLAALLEFAMSPYKKAPAQASPTGEDTAESEVIEGPSDRNGALSFRVEVIDATVIVLANDADPRTQAIHLNIKEVLLSQQAVLALKVDKVGMSFGRMDKPADRVNFLDDLNLALSLDTRRRGSQQMTSFDVDIPDPVVFRASYSNIMLIMDILNKASAAASRATSADGAAQSAAKDTARASRIGDDSTMTGTTSVLPAPAKPSTRRTSVSKRRRSSVDRSQVLISKEELKARINGFQFVLVGDLQELPFVHISTDEFNVAINDWSGDLRMATSVTTSIRYFNLANSHFEPLMDPWRFDLRVNRTSAGPDLNPLSIRLTAAERLEVNLTSAFIELGITAMTLWNKESDNIKEGQSNDAPFKIRNKTGLSMMVWPEPQDLSKEIKKNAAKMLNDGDEVPWRFEDRKATRDNISAVRHNSLGVKLEKCAWSEPLRGISVDRQGEQVLNLRPKTDKVSHQIMCEVKLENNIKVITFRSTLQIDNKTSHPVEMIVVDTHGKAMGGAMRINPGDSCPLPVAAVYDGRFRLRPLKGFGFDYGWSSMIHWTNLMKRPIRPISCKPMNAGDAAFYFQAQANYDDTPASRVYPRMSVTLRAPIEIENLLPYNIKYRIHDKNTGLSSREYLVKGGAFPVHTVELSHLILLSVAPEDTNFKHSDYAIINTDDVELPIEDHFQLTDDNGLKLMLKLHYFTYPDSGGAFKVQVYSPYIFMNKTGLPFDLASETWTGGQAPVPGRSLFENDYKKDAPTPFMFGYPKEDRHHRLFLKVANSKWSKALSFEPVAADMQVILANSDGNHEYYVGLSYAEGLGKYKLTKVITIAPRFMVKNSFEHELHIRQPGSQNILKLAPGETAPIHQLKTRQPPLLAMTLPGSTSKEGWTAPFSIGDIGRTNLTLQRQGARGKTYLMRVETHIQGSSIFIYISRETEPWPLRLQNDTNYDFSFRQVDRDGHSPDPDRCKWTPLEPQSSIPYAWNCPAELTKRIQLYIHRSGDEPQPVCKPIDMMAIGVQPPVRLRGSGSRHGEITLSMDIQVDGNTQVLVISPYREEFSVFKPSRRPQGAVSRSDSVDSLNLSAFETVAVSEKPTFSVSVELEGIGVSVITKKPDELLYFSLRGLKLGYSDFPQYYDAFVDCKWIQIDNQLFGGLFPIILYPTVVPKDGKELESHPTLQASVAVLKDRAHGVWFIKYATILLQAMTIELDEDFVFALLDFVKFKDAAWKEPTPDILIEHPKDIPEPDIAAGQADIFFEALQLQPMALELSFMRTDRVNVDEKVSTRNPFYFALNALTMTIGNVNAAPVNFCALFLENSRLSMPSLVERVRLHYQEQAMAQLYRVLGSADFLGNPVGLFNNISSGFSDIFYEPYQGIVMHGNKDIGLGIARGATSFAKKTVFGITDSMTKFTGAIGKGLSAATLDAEYQSKRRMTQRRNKPKHALYGVAAGASAFANSVTSAFEGVAQMPLNGAEQGGAAGFAKGVGKGVVGLFTKPAVGFMDFLSASTEGIRNTTTVLEQNDLDRVRLPRFIASDGVLRPFSAREALGQSWLKDVNAGQFFNDQYIAHLDIPGDDSVSILSNKRILHVQLRKLQVIWEVPFSELASLSLESSGIALYARDGRPGPFLPIPEKSGRDWYFRHIGRVVSAYNKTHAQRDE